MLQMGRIAHKWMWFPIALQLNYICHTFTERLQFYLEVANYHYVLKAFNSQFLYVQNGDNNSTYFMSILWILSKSEIQSSLLSAGI